MSEGKAADMNEPITLPPSGASGKTPSPADNRVQRYIADAVASGARNLPLDITDNLCSLNAVLLGGDAGKVEVGFKATNSDLQGGGVIGGGVIANMLDTAIAVAALSMLAPGQNCATINLTINMVAAAQAGALRAKASVDRLGKRVAFARAELFDQNDRLVANAISSLAVLEPR